MLGYEGLRPQELLALMDDDVLIDVGKPLIARTNVDGKLFPYLKSGRKRRNRRHRRVDLLEPVAQDFREQRMRTGRRRQLLIARADGARGASTTGTTGGSVSGSRSPSTSGSAAPS
jgi:integrase